MKSKEKCVLSQYIYICLYTACSSWTSESDCILQSRCSWTGSDSKNGECICSSERELDILFGVDTSGSIGYTGFQIQKEFIEGLVMQEINNNGSRIGFFMFNTYVNQTRPIQFWDYDDLILFIQGMWWTGGWTNTQQLITDGLAEFNRTKDPNRQQLFIIITDGNPCLPDDQGGCPQSLCNDNHTYYNDIIEAGVIFFLFVSKHTDRL